MKIPAIAAILALFLFAPAQAAPPDDCLRQIGEAVETGDAEAFQRLVDMDQIINSALDAFLAEAGKGENSAQLAPMLALLFSQAAGQGAQAIKNLLMAEAKAFVLNGVSSGAFAGKRLNGAQPQGYLAPLFANASLGRKEIRGVGEPVRDGDAWLAPFSVHDYGNDQDYHVVGRFEPFDSGARLTRIENLDQLFKQIKKEAEAQEE